MGYDLNKFVDIQDIPTHLRCSICSLVLQDPLQSPCEHSFCEKCITIHLQSTSHCPHHDEDNFSEKSDKKKSPLRKMSFRKIIGKSPKDKLPTLKLSDLKSLPASTLDELNNLRVNCDFNLNGCKEQLTLASLGEHVKKCEYVEELKVEKQSDQTESKQSIEKELSDQLPSDKSIEQSTETTRVDLNEMELKQPRTAQRKDSENKSLNGEAKLVSEEEVGSDDFVVISKNTNSTKSSESVQTNGSDLAVTSGESKENVNNVNKETGEKKKKKKKKKNKANKKEGDAVSLDAASLKGVESNSDQGSKTQSKESLAETEEIKRALREAQAKSDNLRMVNNQLLTQIKQLREEKEKLTEKLQSQLNSSTGEVDELKVQLATIQQENKSHRLRIVQLLENIEQMNKFITTLREEQTELKERYNTTLNDVLQISKLVKTCKQEVQ